MNNPRRTHWRHLFSSSVLGCSLLGTTVHSAVQVPPEEAPSGYRLPSEELVQIVDMPLTPSVRVSPDHRHFLLLEQSQLPGIEELAEPELRLAGLRLNPRNFGRSRTRPAKGMRLLDVETGKESAIVGLPAAPKIGNVEWSPNSSSILFTHSLPDRIELWVVDVESLTATRLSDRPLSLAAGVGPTWLSDSQSIIACWIPDDLGEPPAPPAQPVGPVIQQTTGRSAPARTYQDLLKDAHDELMFEYYLRTQLARVDLAGAFQPLGPAALIWDASPSPDANYLLVEVLHRPFSYLVPASRFPMRVEVWDRDANLVRRLVDRPLQEEIPVAFGSVATGPRAFRWRADVGAALCWAEALDGGDAGKEADERDRLFLLAAPFKGEPTPWLTLGLRFSGVQWSDNELALVTESWWQTRHTRTWQAAPGQPATAPTALFDRSYEDRYNDPGQPMTKENAWGRRVLLRSPDGASLFLAGAGASAEGDRPFVDRHHLPTGETERLFRSEAPVYEQPTMFLDEELRQLVVRRESVDEPPNYYRRDLANGEHAAITSFPHPAPQLRGVQKELIRYERDDGVMLTGTLYLPKDYDPQSAGPLPTLLWAYPREFKNAAAAAQVRGSPYRFNRVSAYASMIWVIQGYAVLDGPTMPIIGEDDAEPNDQFRSQLVGSAQAAIEELVRRGVSEPGRFAIGGHSYGAFMTANLLAHSDLFAAGIARSGAYNRTLTPFGFQSEQRTYWEAPEVYYRMSPFMHADKVNEPILLIHGAADNNSGTFPMQSERYYNALKGHGAVARLVMLPHESHGYRARESILHMLWETEVWLERYVKNAVMEPASQN